MIWRIGADGNLQKVQLLNSAEPGYLHSFAMTDKYLVFVLMPFDLRNGNGAFFGRMRFATARPCRIALVAKDALDQPRWFEADFAAVYHFADAHERDGAVVVRAARHPDAESARSPMAAAMRGERVATTDSPDFSDLHLDLVTGRARWESHSVRSLEFPTFDPRTPADTPAQVYGPCTISPADAPYFNAVMRVDTEHGRVDSYRYGAKIFSEEHRFIPRPGSRRPNDGWLLGTLLDYEHGRSGIALLDAEHVSDGPVAMAWVPYTTPLGFHGWFAGKPS